MNEETFTFRVDKALKLIYYARLRTATVPAHSSCVITYVSFYSSKK